MNFAHSWVLLGLPLLLALAWWDMRRGRSRGGLAYPHNGLLRRHRVRRELLFLNLPRALRWLMLASLIVAAARPVNYQQSGKKHSEGLDIMLALDASQSMMAMDFEWKGNRQNRLQVVKNVVQEFISRRSEDRVGLVVFGSEAFTQAPLTMDHRVLQQFLRVLEIGMAGPETAIGDGLATAIKRLKEVDAQSKIIILLSDGTNTAGQIDPKEAAQLAKTLGVRVYTIAVGSNEPVPFPTRGFFGLEYRMQLIKTDTELLSFIAETTGGKFFQAKDTEALQAVYKTIDTLEKRKIEWEQPRIAHELAWLALAFALLLLVAETLWNLSRWRVLR